MRITSMFHKGWRMKGLFAPSALAILGLFIFVGMAYAQGSRKDDIVFNAQGRPLAGATVRVCTSSATGQPCSPLASIYSDAALTQSLANPISTDGLGNYTFYATPGRYEIEISGPGITTKQLPNVILPSDPSTPTFTTVTTTSGISAFSLSLTGNLTVNGSTSVAGSLTVGGAPVPSTNEDNQWTAAQRFKGPIPYRDFTAYEPTGGCLIYRSSGGQPPGDPATTGSISGGLATLTLAGAVFPTNGCGLAVLGAGPTSSATPPHAAGALTTLSRDGAGQATATCASNCGFDVPQPANSVFGAVISGCADGSFDGTFPVYGGTNGGSTTFYLVMGGASASTGGCSFTALFGYPAGTTGSTTYNYKIVSIDPNEGYSAASAAITITNGNATLNETNYNVIQFDPHSLTTTPWYGIYRDSGSGYGCIGATVTNAFVDKNFDTFPCPVFLPATPPASAGPQTLYTTIDSGAGTSTLTLHTTASSSVTSAKVYFDETSFLNSCLDDVENDIKGYGVSPLGTANFGCLIPSGMYAFEGPIHTAQPSTYSRPLNLMVSGGMQFLTQPWFISGVTGGQITCTGAGAQTGTFQEFVACPVKIGDNVPFGMVVRGNVWDINGFSVDTKGFSAWIYGAGIHLSKMRLVTRYGVGTRTASPLFVEGNTLGFDFENLVLEAAKQGEHIFDFGVWPYSENESCCGTMTNFSSAFGNGLFEGPGAENSPTGEQSIGITNWLSESTLNGGAYVDFDNREIAPGANPGHFSLYGDTINASFADAATSALIHSFDNNVRSTVSNINATGGPAYYVVCGPNAQYPTLPACAGDLHTGQFAINGSMSGPIPQGSGYALLPTTQFSLAIPLNLRMPPQGGGPYNSFSINLPTPDGFAVATTDSTGSLPAATYCMFIVGTDTAHTVFSGTATRTTYPSPEICQAVGANGRIYLAAENDNAYYLYGNVRLYFGTGGPGSENQYILTTPYSNYPQWQYQFASTAGAVSGTIADATGAAAVSFWNGGLICLVCNSPADKNGTDTNFQAPIVIGSHAWDGASKLDLLGGLNIGNNTAATQPGSAAKAAGHLSFNGTMLLNGIAPTIASGFGTSPSIPSNNGTAAFTVNVGTGGSATSGVLTMPTASTGWICHVNDLTAAAAHVAYNTRQTASSTTSVTLENQTTSTGAAVAWAASDILQVSCFAY
jgi:hypothetical protein